MATTLSQNLKLRLDSNLTSDSLYNLRRIDSLGSLLSTNSAEDTLIRAVRNITLEPESGDIGGTGSGGVISLGTVVHPLSSVQFHSPEISLLGDVSLNTLKILDSTSGFSISLSSPALSQDYEYSLPGDYGSPGQILKTDGGGNLSWGDASGINSLATSWVLADGTTKNINHGFGTTNIMVFIYDNDNQKPVGIESLVYTDSNNISLTTLELPGASGYKVLLLEVN